MDGAVVLGDVEVDRPGAKRVGELLERFIQLALVLPVVAFGEDRIFGGVVAHRVEQRVGHVGLKADGRGAIGFFEQLHHALPGVHAAPADFALGGEPFAEALGHIRRGAEGLGDLLLIAFGIFVPLVWAGGRIHADDAVGSDAEESKLLGDAAAFADLLDELCAIGFGAHRGPAAGRRPDGSDHGADDQTLGAELVGDAFEVIVGGVDVDVRVEQEQVHAIKLDAIHARLGGELDHRVEIDRRLGVGAFADEPGPGGVVELGIVVGMGSGHVGSSRRAGPARR